MIRVTDRIHVHTSTCNVYALRNGREAVLIDCGDGSVLDQLASIGVDRVTDVLMTHHHRDQAQGLPLLVAHGARIWVPHAEQDLFHSIDQHWQSREILGSVNNREDRFSLLEPVPVAGTLRDYDTPHFGGYTFTVVPTPGHTTGSITLLTEIDGIRAAFTGDLIYGEGKLWSLAATQWSKSGGEGIAGTILSLVDLKKRQPDALLPSHGAVINPMPAMDLLVERLTKLRDLRRQNPRLFLLRQQPYEPITPHLLRNRTSVANSYVLLSKSSKALLIDFGYDFMFGFAAGTDRAARRPWLYTIPALKRDYGVTKLDVAIPTHYHDDHVAGFNLLRDVEGTRIWAPENFADILQHPTRYDLPSLWHDPIPVDRYLPLGRPVRWEEFELTLHPLPGHTWYAAAIAFEVDGKKVLAVGDQNGDGDGLMLNYAYRNGFAIADYRESAELCLKLKPDLIISGHWDPLWVQQGYLEKLRQQGEDLERLHRELLPLEELDPGAGGFVAAIHPYQASGEAGTAMDFAVLVRNPLTTEEAAEVRLVAPAGWSVEPSVARFILEPRGANSITFAVTPPPGSPVRRVRLAADVTIGTQRFGQQAEALVTVRS